MLWVYDKDCCFYIGGIDTYLIHHVCTYAGPEEANFPLEFIHSMMPDGFPPHKLHLKEGAIVMLIRNLDVKRHLCNGTRLIVRALSHRVLTAEFACGARQGDRVALPRIMFTSDENNLPVVFTRLQFPVRGAFAMTINKSQGQTFQKVGISLPRPVFSHGQLYVAVSRVRRFTDLTFHLGEGITSTRNVVYRELLRM